MRSPRETAALEFVPAVVLVVAGQVESWLVSGRPSDAVLALLGSAPVALWRRAPLLGVALTSLPSWWLTAQRVEDFSLDRKSVV